MQDEAPAHARHMRQPPSAAGEIGATGMFDSDTPSQTLSVTVTGSLSLPLTIYLYLPLSHYHSVTVRLSLSLCCSLSLPPIRQERAESSQDFIYTSAAMADLIRSDRFQPRTGRTRQQSQRLHSPNHQVR